MVMIYSLVSVILMTTLANASYNQPLRNKLAFSDEFRPIDRLLAAFPSDQNTLSVVYKQRDVKGWAMAESNDGYTWKQVLEKKLPFVNEGDVTASTIVAKFSHLVAHDSGDGKVEIGAAKSSRLKGYKRLLDLPGRSPSFFKFKNDIQYLALMHPTKNEVKFYRVQSSTSDSFELKNASTSVFHLPEGIIRSLQFFCFKDDPTECVMSYSLMRSDEACFQPLYELGEFKINGSHLEFKAYPKRERPTSRMDAAYSTSDFRFVKFGNDVMAIGLNERSNGRVLRDFSDFGNSFTIPRVITYSDAKLYQTPLDFGTKKEKKKFIITEDMVLPKAGLVYTLSKEEAKSPYMLDLVFYNSLGMEKQDYVIEFLISNNQSIEMSTNKSPNLPTKEMGYTKLPANNMTVPVFYQQLYDPSFDRARIYVDKSTVTISLENDSIITHSYTLQDNDSFTSIVIRPRGLNSLTLKSQSSIHNLISIWSSKTTLRTSRGETGFCKSIYKFVKYFFGP